MDQYTGPDSGKALLAANGIVITPESSTRLFGLYVAPHRSKRPPLPYFITADTALRAFLEIYQEGFRKFERRQATVLNKTVGRLWAGLAAGRFHEDGPAIGGEARASAAVFAAVAARTLDPAWEPRTEAGHALYKQIERDVSAELERVQAGKAVKDAPLLGRDTDYSRCRPSGFYAHDEALARLFEARAFLSLPMDLQDDAVLQAATALGCMEDTSLAQLREAYAWVIGPEALPAAIVLGGGEAAGEFVMMPEMLAAALSGKELPALRAALRKGGLGGGEQGGPLLMALLPANEPPDAGILRRALRAQPDGAKSPAGLVVLAACGNLRARQHILARCEPARRAAMAQRIDSARKELARISVKSGRGRRPETGRPWHGWREVYRSLAEPKLTPRHPKFMSTQAYADRAAGTAVACWAGARSRFDLRVRSVCMLEGELPRPETGYVEPNLAFWDEMIGMTLDAQELLGEYDAAVGRLASLTRLCMTARRIAAAQLAGEPLTDGQNEWILNYGERLAKLCNFDSNALHLAADRSFVAEVLAGGDRKRALYAGLARPRAIYVIMDYGGRLQLARGGVMSHREFRRPTSEGALGDEQWRKMIADGKAPTSPQWLSGVTADRTGK